MAGERAGWTLGGACGGAALYYLIVSVMHIPEPYLEPAPGKILVRITALGAPRAPAAAAAATAAPPVAAAAAAAAPPPTVILVMVETRFCTPAEKNPRWARDYRAKRTMRRQAAAINYEYARRHGYEFRMYCHANSNGFATAWIKVRILEALYEEAAARAGPTYILLVDSDVYMRAFEVPLPDWLRRQRVDVAAVGWSLMYAKESVVPGKFKKPNWINTGAAYGYVDPADTQRTRRAIDALRLWQTAACDKCVQFQTEDKHPWEQGCLEVLLKESPLVQGAVNVTHSHMNLWNGPWGVFARHAWGGPGKELRKWVFDDMVASHRIDVEATVAKILAGHLGQNLTFDRPECTANKQEKDRNMN